ncbi:MAG: hypothetical protein ABJO09_03970 [Hyphomicrobiales bacterium]|uniref:hypothetical protein n=1 Tax=Nisaea sp. TaxID=2024842 RepID=UPI003289CB4B
MLWLTRKLKTKKKRACNANTVQTRSTLSWNAIPDASIKTLLQLPCQPAPAQHTAKKNLIDQYVENLIDFKEVTRAICEAQSNKYCNLRGKFGSNDCKP